MIWKFLVFAFLFAGVFSQYYNQREQMNQLIRAQCQKVGAEDKVDEVINSPIVFMGCVSPLVNVDQLKNEINVANQNSALNFVFKKYCAKTPQLKSCIHTFVDSSSQCTTSRGELPLAKNGTDSLLDYICYDDGSRLTRFFSEHGPECFQEKAQSIGECANRIKNSIISVEAYESLTMAEKCGKLDEMTTCMVTALKQCSSPTAGDMAESLFRYIRKESPCNGI